MSAIKPLPAILGIAFLIRAIFALTFHNFIAFDEIFQFLEQAHRLVFGQGVIPWEFQVGLRNWLIPLTLAAPMELAHIFIPNPLAGLALVRLLLCLASLPIVACAVKWGGRFHGTEGAWIAGLLTALWPDLWLMAPHPLEEILAADLLVPAIYLISTPQTRRRTFTIGVLLGLAFTLRLQLAPAIAVAGIAFCGRDPRRWAVSLAAAAVPVLAAGLLDGFTWGQPFRSFWLNIYLNLVLNVAKDNFGASPALYYFYIQALDWFWSLPVIAYLAWRGGQKLPMPLILAGVIILTHSLIAHKEYRFIFPAIALIIPLAGVGLAGLWQRLRQAGPLATWRITLSLLLLAGPLASPWMYFLLRLQTNSFEVFQSLAARRPELISVASWSQDFSDYIPIDLMLTGATRFTSQTITPTAAGPITADAIVAVLPAANIPPGFTRQSCYAGTWIPLSKTRPPQICVWTRTGAPISAAAPPFALPFPKAARPYIIPDRLDR
jgi:phosphatidylinositol glycan class B